MTTEQQLILVDLCTLLGVVGVICILICMLLDVWRNPTTLLPHRARRVLTVILTFAILSTIPIGCLINLRLKDMVVQKQLD